MARIDRVVVINDFAEPEGGAGVLALQSVEQYRRLGYPVTFITGQGSSAALEALDVEVVGLGSQPLLQLPTTRAMCQGFNNGRAERMLAEWIARNDTPATAYHLHSWAQILSPAIYRALGRVDVRTIVTCHDFFNICPNGGFLHYGRSEPCDLRPLSLPCLLSQCDRRNALHKYWRIARHFHLKRTARFGQSRCTFSFIDDRMRKKFVRSGFPAHDLIAIPNPVEPWSRTRIPAERNSSFLFVGRIGRDKGADLALEAARQANQPITMVGTGESQEALAAAYPQARFAGWCAREQIIEHARHARALIVPSRVIEPFGLVICEAALSGLPVLVSERAYLASDVTTGGFGQSFDVADLARLTELCRELSASDAKVEQMSRNGYSRAAALCHTPESWISSHIEVFERKLRQAC